MKRGDRRSKRRKRGVRWKVTMGGLRWTNRSRKGVVWALYTPSSDYRCLNTVVILETCGPFASSFPFNPKKSV